MKRSKLYITYSWLLLICFIAGQYMVYSHQHLLAKGVIKTSYISNDHHQPQQTVKEKCCMCDAMHHQAAIIGDAFHFSPQVAVLHIFKACHYNFVSIGLILAAGRAPPVFS
ncbi:hypothetical protein [Mucilaginibacter aquaedulcis]|uniref:hypothetical protein n=1 Tax=Mucilaginibacter aquaedulcis TaxID=1187081 RepID=UPI0025B603BB|nr:hypothetical protein [Mucilaginibacter aquaedulcis]MDN3550973.1 hypothetical protein [Mucilaginibacter aquaedulcis]